MLLDMCRPQCQSNEGAGTAFIGEALHDTWIMLSTLHCFLEEDVKNPVSGKSEIDLLLAKPETLDRMIRDSQERLLRDRIRRYYYWFCYKEDGEHVQLRGMDFVAEHVRVEYSVVSMHKAACTDSSLWLGCLHSLDWTD